jgi:hypothetical protein
VVFPSFSPSLNPGKSSQFPPLQAASATG